MKRERPSEDPVTESVAEPVAEPGSGALPIWQVDAFTDRPFRGNPAAVCLLPPPGTGSRAPSDAWMQRLAGEMNLSETAFLVPRPEDQPGAFDLRWFTPTVEVDLCGHATLASAHVVWEHRLWARAGRSGGVEAVEAPSRLAFHTLGGLLEAFAGAGRRGGEVGEPVGGPARDTGWIELDFPAEAPEPWDGGSVEEVAGALGLEPARVRTVAANRLDLLVEVDAEAVVEELAPEPSRVARLPVRGVIVTAQACLAAGGSPAGGGEASRTAADFVSRYFAPRCGVPEDPVTGSAHCALGPWWAERLGRRRLVGYQSSARGGVVRVQLVEGGSRVRLGGRAVTVLEGRLAVPFQPD